MKKDKKGKGAKRAARRTSEAVRFGKWLEDHGACRTAREWAYRRSAWQAWLECNNLSWLIWLVRIVTNDAPDARLRFGAWGFCLAAMLRTPRQMPPDVFRRAMAIHYGEVTDLIRKL